MPRSRAVLMRALTDSAGCSVLKRDELLGDLGGQSPRLAPVGATLRVQSVEAA